MMKKIMMKVGDNRGMTLMEVIVALMLFVFVFLILGYGINSALKVMGNANAINNATQSNASGLESLGTSLESSQKATLTPLGNKLLINNCALNGKFETATTSKTNDGTSMTLTLFQPAAPSATVPLPTLTAEPASEGRVVVPTFESKKAYYSPDTTYTLSFIHNDGMLDLGAGFNNSGPNTYISYYGSDLGQGVVPGTMAVTWPVTSSQNAASTYLPKLFFINTTPFTFRGNSASISFAVKFLYLGDGTNDFTLPFDIYYTPENYKFENYTFDSIQPDKFVLYSYNNNVDTILYLPSNMTLEAKANSRWGEQMDSKYDKSITINSGYYKLPNNTDLLSAVYNTTEHDKYSKTVSNGGYKVNYSDIADYLTSIGVITR